VKVKERKNNNKFSIDSRETVFPIIDNIEKVTVSIDNKYDLGNKNDLESENNSNSEYDNYSSASINDVITIESEILIKGIETSILNNVEKPTIFDEDSITINAKPTITTNLINTINCIIETSIINSSSTTLPLLLPRLLPLLLLLLILPLLLLLSLLLFTLLLPLYP
jgi:hypothetical protein